MRLNNDYLALLVKVREYCILYVATLSPSPAHQQSVCTLDCKHFLSSRHQHVLHSHISQPVHGGEGGGGDGRGTDGDWDSSGIVS